MLTLKELKELEDLNWKYRIHFHDEISESAWPATFASMFRNIEVLGSTRFRSYARNPEEVDDQLWKLDTRDSALELKARASQCNGQDEGTWRSLCEPVILARIFSEVVW